MSSAHEQRAAQIACWSGGDYRSTAAVLQPAAEVVLDLVGPVAGLRVLDVAAGTGNVAAAATRRGASVTATDLSPRMVELGRARTADAGLAVEWMQADACDLPFDDASFDVVTSTFGLMFATPRPAAVEAARVLREEQVAAMSDAFVAVHRPHVDAEGRVRTTMRYVVITARRNGRTAR